MTFKKLEHAQRHERTHTLDRPYVCEQCGKTFARQDTLHRHSRLHNRADDDAPTAKTGRKRRASIAGGGSTGPSAKASSSGTSKSAKDGSGSSPSESSNGSSSGVPKPIPIAHRSGDLLVGPPSPSHMGESYSDSFGLSMSLPGRAAAAANEALHSGAPPSFPAYSQPTDSQLSHQQQQQQQPEQQSGQFPHFPSIDPAVIPLCRRYSDAGHGAAFASQLALGASAPAASAFTGAGGAHGVGSLPTSFVTSFSGGRSLFTTSAAAAGAQGGSGGSQASKRERPSLRPRALTLAGLPESLGCFSLVNSPEPSDAGSNSSAEDDDDADGDDSMDLGDAVSRLIGSSGSNSTRTTASLGEPSAPPESHYPSPAFTCDSPNGLNLDPVADLRAILDNDPVPSSVFHHQTLSPPPTGQPEFDFESFAASIEGPIRQGSSPSAHKDAENGNGAQTSLDELLSSTAHDFEGPPVLGNAVDEVTKLGVFSPQSAADRYPTPPSGSLGGSMTLHPESSVDTNDLFEPSASYHIAAHIDKAISHIPDPAGRDVLGHYEADAADHAATAVMFASGFGVSSAAAPSPAPSAAQLSALGLSFGLPHSSSAGGNQLRAPPSARTRASRHNSFAGFPSHRDQQQYTQNAVGSAAEAPLLLPISSAPLGSGSPYSAQQANFAAALSATYTTAFPTLTLPIAGFDLPTTSSFKHDTPPSLFIPGSTQQQREQHAQQQQQQFEKGLFGSAPPSSSSHFDRLAKAWEERQRAAGLSTNFGAAPYANLKNPYASPTSTGGGTKSTPAFYIPSSTATVAGHD
ncbi:hypothetical protein BMF94_2304 [Rhodotorula taiwanensis]|uniref:C2H2-type domain-containing protein n=1 Tax=Rhodotorula taiwanensis TaxID=741276 RepID=A0A2S5BCQ9_9BASI|nr:hypothetical protein BMF94_2304 [Rhodotorula taiwanensis]